MNITLEMALELSAMIFAIGYLFTLIVSSARTLADGSSVGQPWFFYGRCDREKRSLLNQQVCRR